MGEGGRNRERLEGRLKEKENGREKVSD